MAFEQYKIMPLERYLSLTQTSLNTVEFSKRVDKLKGEQRNIVDIIINKIKRNVSNLAWDEFGFFFGADNVKCNMWTFIDYAINNVLPPTSELKTYNDLIVLAKIPKKYLSSIAKLEATYFKDAE